MFLIVINSRNDLHHFNAVATYPNAKDNNIAEGLGIFDKILVNAAFLSSTNKSTNNGSSSNMNIDSNGNNDNNDNNIDNDQLQLTYPGYGASVDNDDHKTEEMSRSNKKVNDKEEAE
eukprot:CAMPEP_0201593508 /NCGR_PEP_ID=MMETSP0190_2-20130828/191088_1 /ASSEMBLY_ACC=CAM_ASM_000263 /TAXON_ID=37353 /ORGANISM="Rosalina sp." /LENGTH=116 /DNA_ID=CAMNT_0048052719 /DNA_START=154 /DNA_END=504 /DNA_ORIENTATION=+